jgi:maltose alpha-D-glucosyltransferase / alpha-amylase
MIDRTDRLWFKTAVFYEVHVKAFADANGDGIGDFAGFISKLDYLQDLGVTAIWLLPFYPSPQLDDGYDIAAYRAIHESYGSMRDFRRMVRACHKRGMRVVTELVINHTSNQHRWFKRARLAKKGSPYRDYYVWSDNDKEYPDARIIFVDTEKSNWSWDPVAQAYYWHRFYSHQPDLNFDNPRVLREVISVMRFWLDAGVDGLRLDAIPYLVERPGTNGENLPETHEVIRKIRAEIEAKYPDRILLAEANQWPEDVAAYFGKGDECHMCYHFPVMPRMYMAIAQEDRHPLTDIMRQTPEIPDNCQWAIFLRNHDELTLEMVTERERDYLWTFYAADRRMRLNLGIRRRLAPLLDNDRRKIELMNSLLLSLPGTPFLYYGDEIGMGDNVYLGDRNGVRTPMQWSPDRNGGFSRADPATLYLPPIMDPIYGYEAVNVEAQLRSPTSLLNWMKRLIAMRQQNPALRAGRLHFLYPGNRKVLAYLLLCDDGSEAVLCVANLSHSAQAVELSLADFKGRVPIELLGRSSFPPIGDLPYLVTLPAYGFHWFVLAERAAMPAWHEEAPPPLPEFTTLVMNDGWQTMLTGREGRELEQQVLPVYLAQRRWFAAKDDRIKQVRVCATTEVASAAGKLVLLQSEVTLAKDRGVQRYLLPLGLSWSEDAGNRNWPLLPYMIARVRQRSRLGAIFDATASEVFGAAMLEAIRDNRSVDGPDGRLAFRSTASLAAAEIPADAPAHLLGGEQSNTSLNIADKAVLKLYRRLTPGEHPEIEMTRFLTETAGYANTPRLLGDISYTDREGTKWAIGLVQEFVRSQGCGWDLTINYLDRVFDTLRVVDAAAEPVADRDRHAIFLEQVRILARRIAEMHRALASDVTNPDFQPESVTATEVEGWRRQFIEAAEAAFDALQVARKSADEAEAAKIADVIRRKAECIDRFEALTKGPVTATKIRIHGDLHLGQILVVQNDFYVIDFEGEPARTLAERRAKSVSIRDVAGMLRSFEYAGWSALHKLADRDSEGYQRLLPHADAWRQLVQLTFLENYQEAIAGCASYPADPAEVDRLLGLFLLDKVLYEIRYEAANRPAWLRIPLSGLAAILDSATMVKEKTLVPA